MNLTETFITRRAHVEAQLALISDLIAADFDHHRLQNIEYLAMATPQVARGELRYRMASFRVNYGFVPARDRVAMGSWQDFEVKYLMSPTGQVHLMLANRKTDDGRQWEALDKRADVRDLNQLITDRLLVEMNGMRLPEDIGATTLKDSEICFQVVPSYPLVEPVDVECAPEGAGVVLKVETLEQRRARLAAEMKGQRG